MKNNFQSNGKGRNQRVWQLLISMLFILTMGIGQMWGAAHTVTPNISGTQYEIYNIYSNSSSYAFFSNATTIRSAYTSWVSGELSSKSDGGATVPDGWLATGSGKPGYGKGKVNNTKTVTMTVTNCIEVAFVSKSGGSRTSNLSVKYGDEEVGTVATNGNTYNAVVYGTTLDATKTYTITLSGSNSSDCEVDQIRFKAPAGSVCTASLGGTTSNASATAGVSAGTITCTVNNGAAASATSYQWYRTASNKEAASSISGATSSSYSPNEASAGTYYYYCKVTTTQITTAGAAGSVETDLSGAFVFAEAAACTNPTITTDLSTTQVEYNKGATATALEIVATGDALTYQWYSNTSNTTEGGTSLGSTAQSASYTPSTAVVGTKYYYCIVSSGTCTTTSAIANIKVNAVRTSGWVIFDGMTDDSFAAGSIEYSDVTVSYSVAGNTMLDASAVATRNTNNNFSDEYIPNAVKVEKNDGSSTGYVSFSIPANYQLKRIILAVAYAGGSRNVVLATSAVTATDHEDVITSLHTGGSSNRIYSVNYQPSTALAAGTYYICSPVGGTWNIFHLQLVVEAVPSCVTPPIAWATTPADATEDAVDMTASVTIPDGQTVTWTSSNTDVATVSNAGVIDYKTPGTTTIKAEYTYSGSVYCEEKVSISKEITVTAHVPTVADLVTIDADYAFEPNATITAGTITADNKFFAPGPNDCDMSGGKMRIKENRALAFKVAANAKVRVTFTTNGNLEMQLGTATTDDDNKAYGHSKSSPFTSEVISTGGVVYLTASEQLYMSKLEILYPHTVTYALNGGDGTLPTESAHYVGDKFNLHDGEDGITAPTDKEFAGWNDGTTTYVGGAEYTMGASAVMLTAQWTTPLPEPTITFNNGAYTIGGAALDLSTLFSSNSDGAVTYTVKTAGETGATIAGTSFTATAAGSAVVTASQAATASYKAKSVDATITISAPTEPEGVKLVVANALTGNFRSSRSLSDGSCTVAGISYSKYVTMGSTYTSWGPDAGPSGKYFSYTVQKKSTRFYFYVNNTGSAAKIHLYTSAEGSAAAATKNDIDVAAGTSLVTYDLATTTNTEVFIGVSSTNIRFCQIVAVESGDSHLTAPAVGYAMSLNKGRLSTASGTATTIDGLTFVVSSGYKPAYNTAAQVGTKGTHYVSFTIPDGQTRQLQLTTNNTNKYTVSKTLGDDENQFTPTADEAKNWNLTDGTWYINPQGSNVNITNIVFAAAPAQKTVTFKDGASTLDTKYVWSGDKVSALDPAPTKDGYRFVKWQLSGADYDFNTAVTADIVLDAVWQKTWTVTFNSDGGSDVAAATVDDGQAVAQPANPTKSGFDFVEWQLNSATYNFASAVEANITLVATWEVAQDDASLSALSYNSNAIDVSSAVDVSGVQTYTVHLPWGSSINAALISVTKNAQTATLSDIVYDSENKRATFMVTSGNHTVSINYAIQFVIDAKVGTSIVKAVISGGDQKAGFDATGIYGDKGYGYTRSNKKLDTADKYVGVKLLAGKTFAAGDKLFVVTSTDADRGYIEIYEEAEGTNLIKATGVRDASEGIEVAELAGYSEFYIVRKETDGDQAWNGTVDYVEVTREMAPAIKSFKFGDDAATINEGAKTITIEMPYSTDVTALTPTIEAYGNNGATYTPSGATDFTSPVDYVVTDAYGELSTTYAVTVSKAAPSENAYLASLSVAGYPLNFNKATTEYNVVLDYGTTALPAISYEVEDTGLAEAIKAEGGVNGATTITVTPQAGAGYEKVYTINFSVSTTPKFVIFDGSTMSSIAESGSDNGTGFAWTITGQNTLNASNASGTFEAKAYTKEVNLFTSATKGEGEGDTRYMTITIPENYVAKFRLVGTSNSNSGERSLFISKTKTGVLDQSIAYATSETYNTLAGMTSAFQLPGTYYLCATKSIRLYELSIQLYPIDKQRTLTPGMLATVCLPNSGVMLGASIFEVAYYDVDSKKIFFDEVEGGVMEAGMPYIVLANEGSTQFAVKYTGSENAAAQTHHGLAGWLGAEKSLAENEYFIYDNKYYYVNAADAASGRVRITAEHAYIPNIADVPGYGGTPYPAPAPGRRRVALDAQGTQVATGIEGVEATEITVQKVLINGQMYILRGEQMYDATGRLVK